MSLHEVPSASVSFAVPDDVLNYCRAKGINDDLDKALGVVRAAFPDLRKTEIALEDHEVLDRVVRIHGEVPDAPTNVAQRIWDCIACLDAAVSRDGFLYLQLDIDPEGE